MVQQIEEKAVVETPEKKGRGFASHKNWWKPGQSGNPNGKPRGVTFSSYVRQVLEANNGKIREKIIRKLSDERPEILLHYAYGKPMETVDLINSDQSLSLFPLAIAIAQQLSGTNSQGQVIDVDEVKQLEQSNDDTTGSSS